MSSRIASHLRSNIVGYVALFVALSGTAYAVDGPLEGQNQVGSDDIINGEVKRDDLGSDAVRTGKVLDGTLTGADIATGGVTSEEVEDDSLGQVDVQNESLSGVDIANGTLTSGDIFDNTITSSDLGTGSVGESEIADQGIGVLDLATDSVNSAHIIDGEITNDDLGANSVTGAKVFPSSLTGADVLANSLTSSDIGEGAVGSSEVANQSLGTAEFAGSIPAVQVTRTTDQGVLNNTATTLNFNAERYDTAGMHSNSSNISRLTAPVPGIYAVTASIAWGGQAFESGQRTFALRKNGSTEVAIEQVNASVAENGNVDVNFATMLKLGAGDFLQALVRQNSGEDLSIITQQGENGPEFSMTWLAPGP